MNHSEEEYGNVYVAQFTGQRNLMKVGFTMRLENRLRVLSMTHGEVLRVAAVPVAREVGFGCSFAGKWWGGYARGGEGRNYCQNAKNSILKKVEKLHNVYFSSTSYDDVEIEQSNSMLYCDIPYKDTTGYSVGNFNHEQFYTWAKKMKVLGHTVLVSEYEHNVPEDWKVVWRYESKKDIRDKGGVQQPTVEILMTPC